MTAAIVAAIGTLVGFALLILIIGAVYNAKKSKRDITVGMLGGNDKHKMRDAQVGPAPIAENISEPEPSDIGKPSDRMTKTRFFALGAIVTAMLGTLLVKLWSMQIISSDTYTSLAESNYTTSFSTRAVRGRILDRNGNELVGNRATLAVMASPDVKSDRNTVHRLSNVLGIPRAAILSRMSSTTESAQADRVVASDVTMRVASFIAEHPDTFPGVSVESRTVRTYPYGQLAAHVLGYTGTISETELASYQTPDGLSYESGDTVGKDGAELAFEDVLQGVKGTKTVLVDASGNVLSVVGEADPQKGNDIRLTIDINMQAVAEQCLQDAMSLAASKNFPNANAGALVALDLSDNGVVAMASWPTYSPSDFIGGISTELWDSLNSDGSLWPLTNRAIAGLYPAASTFKAFVAMAALKYGYATVDSSWYCSGVWTEMGDEWAKKCWLESGHGWQDLVGGITVSCDVVFYSISYEFYHAREEAPNALQEDVETWGFGSKTGIELGGEAIGRIPTEEWKADYFSDTPEDASWNPGDMANLAIGQGDVLVTPLQMAVGYSAIATGKLQKPHVLYDVLGEDGSTVISYTAQTLGSPEFTQGNLDLVHQGLVNQVNNNATWTDFPIQTAGKTGTGQVAGKDDMGWYVGYAPADAPQYLVAMCLEQGGAASNVTPSVRKMMAALFGIQDDSGGVVDTSGDERR